MYSFFFSAILLETVTTANRKYHQASPPYFNVESPSPPLLFLQKEAARPSCKLAIGLLKACILHANRPVTSQPPLWSLHTVCTAHISLGLGVLTWRTLSQRISTCCPPTPFRNFRPATPQIPLAQKLKRSETI